MGSPIGQLFVTYGYPHIIATYSYPIELLLRIYGYLHRIALENL
jgi:hypothetical protein